MEKENVKEFKMACRAYLVTVDTFTLRTYGRYIQLDAPTALNKSELIQNIISVLCGEIVPSRTRKGAPVKSTSIPQSLIETVTQLQDKYLLIEDRAALKKDLEIEQSIHYSKLKPIGILRSIDEQGRLSLPMDFRERMGLKDSTVVEEMLYEDENGQNILVVKKFASK